MKDAKSGVHPQVVARAFHVHLRTVFRWVSRKHLPSRQGLVNRTVVLKLLRQWKNSCSFGEAKERLSAPDSTLIFWKKRNVLQPISVLGTERVTRASVAELLKQKRNGYSFFVFAQMLRVKRHVVSRYAKLGRLEFKIVRGRRVVPKEKADAILRDWKASCTPGQACAKLEATYSGVKTLIRSERLKCVEVFGQRRILLDSIQEVLNEKKQNELAKAKSQTRSKRMLSIDEAAAILGKSRGAIQALYERAELRGETVEETLLLYAHSVEIYKSRMRRAS